VKFINLAEISL